MTDEQIKKLLWIHSIHSQIDRAVNLGDLDRLEVLHKHGREYNYILKFVRNQ